MKGLRRSQQINLERKKTIEKENYSSQDMFQVVEWEHKIGWWWWFIWLAHWAHVREDRGETGCILVLYARPRNWTLVLGP